MRKFANPKTPFCAYVYIKKGRLGKAAKSVMDLVLDLRDPKAMEIAIGVNRDKLLSFFQDDGSLGGIPGLQEAERSAAIGLEVKPFDVMGLDHRVGNRTDFGDDVRSFDFDDGNVLLDGRFNGAGFQFQHGFAAANRDGPEFIELCNDRTAG